MSLFDLLAQVLQALASWCPRPLLVPRTHAAVVWLLSFKPRVLRGLLAIVPLVETYTVYDLRWDAMEFEPKTLWTRDGHEVSVGIVVMWRIADPLLLGEKVNGIDSFVGEVSESVLPEVVGLFDLEVFKRKVAGGEGREWSLEAHLTTRVRKLLEPYGLEVDYARANFTSAKTRTFNIIGGRAV